MTTEAPRPPLTPRVREEARRRPGGWVPVNDLAYGPRDTVPPDGVLGSWQVDARGEVLRFWPNPGYRPSLAAQIRHDPEHGAAHALRRPAPPASPTATDAPSASWRTLWTAGLVTRSLAWDQRQPGALLVLDAAGRLRRLAAADGRELAGAGEWGPAGALGCTIAGDLLLLRPDGRLTVRRVEAPERSVADLADSVAEQLDGRLGAVSPLYGGRAVPGLAVGDTSGRVHFFRAAGKGIGAAPPPHQGPVRAVALIETQDGSDLLVLSGGEDGRVAAWIPGVRSLPALLDARPHPVTALAATGATPGGLLVVTAWADGLVRIGRPNRGTALDLGFGAPVHALAVGGDGRLVVATGHGLSCLLLEVS
ncbi:hypothetical protein [Kitasatospora viridis]|uniref:WD40 repeat protein n=1 Tax=Kitasatospora viridis TaxID=281105 RepID=A0A561T7D3_9ACTN|nr:hypothetical protein [Kitasatospora viridis]TWF83023.1 hypothetical protein FHX73_14506 [Kitasatospora viridis]